jgi:hypothetical protein
MDKIILPFAADFYLYDHEAKIWARDLAKVPTLYHICGIRVPRGLSSTILKPQQHPAEGFDGPTSYETQANITKCPSTMSVAEFSTYQKLLAGKFRRWPKILVELGSSNLDFSSEDTTLTLTQLAVQAGPRSPEVERTNWEPTGIYPYKLERIKRYGAPHQPKSTSFLSPTRWRNA